MQTLFTAGALRALQLADIIARTTGAATVEPAHLLWALLLGESRASEMIADVEKLRAALHQLAPLPAEFSPPAIGDSLSTIPEEHPESDALRTILVETRQQTTLLGKSVEVGSEHLLWGLSYVPSPVSNLLQAHGLHPEQLAGKVAEQIGISSEPIPEKVRLSLPAGRQTDHADVYRLLDAAANRTREGLRVLEDYARFALDDAHLTTLLKNWRHNLTQSLLTLDARSLLTARDTQQDVGTVVHTRHEQNRASLHDVVAANFKRVQEGIRTLEECGKVLSSELGSALERLRYDLYTIERAVLLTQAGRERFDGHLLYLLVTEELCPKGSGPLILAALAGGASIIQVREKTMSDRKLLDHAHRVREWTTAANAIFIMNDRPDIALLADADGVHVGQDELPVREVRRIIGPEKLVGVSTHTIEQARQAVLDGADYIGVGPVFPSKTKQFDQFAGLEFVRQIADEITLPAFAIGGIQLDNVAQVVAAGARRIAVSSAVSSAPDAEQMSRDLLSQLEISSKESDA